MSRKIRTLYCAMAVGLAAGICTTATPAQAESGTPYNCFAEPQGSYGQSYCASGSGLHRVKVICKRASNPNAFDIVYGIWRPSGYYSDGRCLQYGDIATKATYQLATA